MTGLRFSMPFLAAALLAGCQHGPGGTIDPFGRTTIPPPPTGTAAIHSKSNQYYGNSPRPMVPVASKPGNTTASNPAPPNTQAANWVSNTSTTADPHNRLQPIPPYEKEAAPVTSPPTVTPPTVTPPTATPVAAKPVAAKPAAPAATSTTVTPPATSQPQHTAAPTAAPKVKPPKATPIDPTAPLQWSSGNPAPSAAPAVATTAHTKPSTGQNVTVRREPVQQNPSRISRYGHTKDYTSVRGQLEYSAKDRVWIIRYIPIHGQQDAYGGQFVLSDRSKLEAFQAGDYVTIEGSIVAAATKAEAGPTGDAPLYKSHRVAALAP